NDLASTAYSPLSGSSSVPPPRSTTCTARLPQHRNATTKREREGSGKREAGRESREGKARAQLLCGSLGCADHRRDNHSQVVLPDGRAAQCNARLSWTGFRSTTRLLCAVETGPPGTRRARRAAASLGNWC